CTAGYLAVSLDLAERRYPLGALKRWRQIGEKLIGALQDERANTAHPGSLRRGECKWGQAPHAWARRQRRERRGDRNGREASVAGAPIDDVCRGGQPGREPGSFWCTIRNQRQCLCVEEVERRCLTGKVIDKCSVCSFDHRRIRGRPELCCDSRAVRRIPAFD